MQRVSTALSAIVFSLVVLGASHGATLVVEGGPSARAHVPATVAYDGEGDIALKDPSGKTYPGTARNGELTVVLDTIGANETKSLTVAGEALKPAVEITKKDGENILEVRINGELFTAYHYADDLKKPFLWPVNSEGGATVTRDWPMGEADRSKDHPHHVSLYTAYGNINGVDCWATGGNSGFQTTQEVTWGSGAAYGWIHAQNVWQDKEHNNVINETREYRFYNTPASARLLDVRVTFDAEYGDAKFADTKEGGLVTARMADALCERGGTGTITLSTGAVNEREAWGKPAAWCDYSGTLEGVGARGLAIFDHPDNLRHPTNWHVRSYGLMGANCFGYNDFTRGEKNGDYTLGDGDSVTFNYRVYVHSGDVDDAKVAERYADYATPPSARWAE